MYKHILVPTDGSLPSKKAFAEALRIAKALGARLTLLHVVPPWIYPVFDEPLPNLDKLERDYLAATSRATEKILGRLSREASAAAVPCEAQHVTASNPAQAIVDKAKAAKCDLIVMGSHGRTGLARYFLGSETARVLALTRLPVLVTH